MSVEKHTYLIVGYDLSKYRQEILTEDFYQSVYYEDLTCYQYPGKVQYFHDPMSGGYLYFGYIVAENSEYDDNCYSSITFTEFLRYAEIANKELKNYIPQKIACNIDEDAKVIMFTEYT